MAKSSGGGEAPARASVVSMVLMRLFVGGFFLYSVIADKFLCEADGSKAHGVACFVQQLAQFTGAHGRFIDNNVWPTFANVLQHTVAPRAELFAWLIMLGELAVGCLLVIGLLSRGAALLAMLLNALYLLATMHLGAAYLGINLAFLSMELGLVIAAPGRTLGLDVLLARRTRFRLLW